MKACDVTTKFYPTSSEPAALLLRGSGAPAKADRLSGSLGTYTNFPSTPPPDGRDRVRETRAQRYHLQSVARGLLLSVGRVRGMEYPENFHRVCKCQRTPMGSVVGVRKAQQHGAAFYSGLVTCGSVSACPVCNARVSEVRRGEIHAAVDWAYRTGVQPVMVTLTFPHRAWHSLRRLLQQQAHALELLRSGGAWTRFKERTGYKGLIRSLEVTHGDNGWHPHTHELWFVSGDSDAEAMRAKILDRWQSSCIRAGLLDPTDVAQVQAFRAHAVDVKGWCSAGDYLAKGDDARAWGVDRELTKGSAKGRHPFALLADAGNGDRRAGRLFIVYALAMKGRSSIRWSQGLRDLVGVRDMTDEEAAEQSTETAELLGTLTGDQWRTIRAAGARARVLDAAELGGWPGVLALLDIVFGRVRSP